MNFESARDLYPGAREGVYFDTANFGLSAIPVMEAVSGTMKELTRLPRSGGGQRWLDLESQGARARRELATLVGAAPDEIALVESTTHGLRIAAETVPLAAGDEVLIADWDFVGVSLTWQQLAERKGVQVRSIDLGRALDPTANMIEAIRPETRAVCTSSVAETLGTRLDLRRLAKACHARGLWLLADVMQEAGARRLELGQSGVDLAVCGGHKWLGCPFGVGFLFVRRERLADLNDAGFGYAALEEPEGGWEFYLGTPAPPPAKELRARDSAQRLEIGGTPNFIGRRALAESAALLNRLGINEIETRVLTLTNQFREELVSAGLDVLTPRESEARAGIVCFTLGDSKRDQEIVQRLMDQDVFVSCRYRGGVGGVRASLHFYNNERDIERFVTALARSTTVNA